MADIDDELLALAGGGDESSDEGDISMDDGNSDASASPRPRKKSSSGKGSKKPAPKRSKKQDWRDDSEGEGRASSAPGTPNSLDSAPMDESDSDAEQQPRTSNAIAKEEEKYPVEGLYTSHEEKEEIENMVEFEREQILAERIAEKEKRIQNLMLRQMVSQEMEGSGAKDGKWKKRTAETAELEDGERKSSRQRSMVKGNDNSAMSSLRRAKAEKDDRQRRRQEDRERQQGRGSPGRDSRTRDRSVDSYDHSPNRGHDRAGSPYGDKSRDSHTPLGLTDMRAAQLTRGFYVENFLKPKLEDAIIGSYARINVGPHPETGVPQYRMGVVQAITEDRPYAIEENKPGKFFITKQYVKLAHGKAVRDFPIIRLSNDAFTESEWNRYKITCSVEECALPKKAEVSRKANHLRDLRNAKLTDKEIDTRWQRKQDLIRPFDDKYRRDVNAKLARAEEMGDKTRIVTHTAELEKLGPAIRLAFGTSLYPTNDAAEKEQLRIARIAEINKQRREENYKSVSGAQSREFRKARGGMARTTAPHGSSQTNDETSVKSAPAPSQPSSQTANTETLEKPDVEKAKTNPVDINKLRQELHDTKGMFTFHKPIDDDDVIASMDLDIDIDI